MKWRGASAAAVGTVVAGLLVPSPAWAAPTTSVVQGDVLRLVSVADWDAASSLLPGQPVQWDVTVSANAPDPGTVSIALSATGDAPLTLEASLCTREWESAGCPGSASVLKTAWDIPRDGAEFPLAEIQDTERAHLRLSVALGAGVGAASTQLRVHARGAGESVTLDSAGDLAITGVSPSVPWILAGGAVLVVFGLLLAAVCGRRRPSRMGGGES